MPKRRHRTRGEGREHFRSCLARWSARFSDEPREFIAAAFVDRGGKVMEEDVISWGGLEGAVLDLVSPEEGRPP